MNQQENAALTERAARRALYSCLFSIVACAIMLFGTTFAWFTANQTSGVNTMTAANFGTTAVTTTRKITNQTTGAKKLVAAPRRAGNALSTGENTITLTRTGSSTANGYCVLTISYDLHKWENAEGEVEATYNDAGLVTAKTQTYTRVLSDSSTPITEDHYYSMNGLTEGETLDVKVYVYENAQNVTYTVNASWGSEESDLLNLTLGEDAGSPKQPTSVELTEAEEQALLDAAAAEEAARKALEAEKAAEEAEKAAEEAAKAAEEAAKAEKEKTPVVEIVEKESDPEVVVSNQSASEPQTAEEIKTENNEEKKASEE